MSYAAAPHHFGPCGGLSDVFHGFRCRCSCCHAWNRFQSSVPSLGNVPSSESKSSCCCCYAWNLNGGPLDGGALKLASNLNGGGVGWEATGGEEEAGAPTWGSSAAE